MLYPKLKLSFYKNKFNNCKCFIIGTGPSIKKQDLSLISDQFIIGVNSFYNHEIKSNFYVISDHEVWKFHKESIKKRCLENCNEVFLCTPYLSKEQFVVNCKIKLNDLSESYDPDWYDANKGVYRSGTVIIAALQIAFYMGVNKVFLLGCDCEYKKDQEHFDNTKVCGVKKNNWKRVFRQYDSVKNYYDKYEKPIFNCTYGGKLEVFPRIILEEAISC